MLPDDAETRFWVSRETTEAEAKLAADVGENKGKVIHSTAATMYHG